MKKYVSPTITVIEVSTQSIMSLSDGRPNDKWSYDENDNLVNPGGHTPPGHNKNDYRSNLWE